MTRPISEGEGNARTLRGFRAVVIALWVAMVVSMLVGVHYWTAKDYVTVREAAPLGASSRQAATWSRKAGNPSAGLVELSR